MSDNDNYWSDEEDTTELIQDDKLFPPTESDEEYDSDYEAEREEYERLINEKILNKIKNEENCDYNINSKFSIDEEPTTKLIKPKKEQRKKVFVDLSKKEENNNKPKKWRSKRMNDKKEPDVVKRKFNPRLPPPGNLFKNKKKNTYVNLKENDFPEFIHK
jgi:hypothetical protein